MTTKQFVALEKTLLPDLPGFVIKGPLMLIPPTAGLLRAILFERTSSKEWFKVWAFVQPLYIPSEYIFLTFGQHLRRRAGGNGWNASTPDVEEQLADAVKQQGLPYLQARASPLDLLNTVQIQRDNERGLEALSFTLARAGRVSEALVVIDNLLERQPYKYPWQQDVADLANILKEKLLRDPDEAQQQLKAWENETLHNLKLDEYIQS